MTEEPTPAQHPGDPPGGACRAQAYRVACLPAEPTRIRGARPHSRPTKVPVGLEESLGPGTRPWEGVRGRRQTWGPGKHWGQ